MLTSVFHTGPVTALTCSNTSILAGIGSRLHVYRVEPVVEHIGTYSVLPGSVIHGIRQGIGSRLHVYRVEPVVEHIGTYSVLPGSVIHGIRQEPCDDEGVLRLCVFGQKCLRVIRYDHNSYLVELTTDVVLFDDWIWDIAWLQGGKKLGLALGHNVIVVWDVVNKRVVSATHCTEKCILYCAKFLTSQEDHLILAAGTVFNQVVLWSPASKTDDDGRIEPFHRLTGHQGVIFSVDHDAVSQRICSVSDDRSVRLYHIRFPQSENNGYSLCDWENMETSLLHVLYGHSARVWDVRLMTNVFVSVGEDATCCVWNYNGKVMQKFKGHKGKSIWSMAVDKGEKFIVTGGGDCSIRLWQIDGEEPDMSVNTSSVDLKIGIETEVLTSLCVNSNGLDHMTYILNQEINVVGKNDSLKLDAKDFPRSVAFLADEKTLVMTNDGLLVMYDTYIKLSRCIMKEIDFASYSVLSVSPNRLVAALGNINGTLRLISWDAGVDGEPEVLDSVVYQGRICSIIWLDNYHVLTSGPKGEADVWSVVLHCKDRPLEHLAQFELPASKHRWASAAAFTQDRSLVICGDRAGSVLLYDMEGHLVQIFPRIHKADVTHVCLHGNQVYTTGRDGVYRLYDLKEKRLTLLNSSKVFKGFGWIERLTLTEDGDILIQGFSANKFLVWSVNQNQKLLEVESGGGHRSWDFLFGGCHGNIARLLYIKAREILIKDIQLKSNQVIVRGCLHGRELCDVRHIASCMDISGKPVHLLATCSEDTLVSIGSLGFDEHNQADLQVSHSLSGHISSVRCLAVCKSSVPSSHHSDQNRKLLFSGGGRAQIKIWRLDVDIESSSQPSLATMVTIKERVNPDNTVSEDFQTKPIYIRTNDTEAMETASCYSENSDIDSSVIKAENCDRKNEGSNNALLQNLHATSSGNQLHKAATACKISGLTDHSETQDNFLSNNSIKTDDSCNSQRLEDSEKTGQTAKSAILGEEKNSSEYSVPKTQTGISDILCQYESLAGVQLGCDKKRMGKPWRVKVDNSDPETRILDLTVFRAQDLSSEHPEGLYFLTAACSDGLIRFFLFEEDSREVTFITSSNFHDHCVLKVQHVIHRSEHSVSVVILSAATDGRVAFWKVTDLCNFVIHTHITKEKDNEDDGSKVNVYLEKRHQSQHAVNPDKIINSRRSGETHHGLVDCGADRVYEEGLEKLKLVPAGSLTCHQSGINALHFEHFDADTYILVTGGDDNAVHVTLITKEKLVAMETDSERSMSITCTGSTLSAHAAQVTGVWYLGQNTIVTASIDQRICVWCLTVQDSKIELELQDCKFIDVSDIANIDVWRHGDKLFMAACGEGLEIMEIQTKPLDH